MSLSVYTQEALIFGAVFVASWIAVSSRIYVRLFIVKNLGVDDWFIIITLISFTAIIALAIKSASLGLGVRDRYLSSEEISQIIKLYYLKEIIYIATTVTLKMSIAILLLRFARGQTYRRLIIGTMAIYALCGLVFIFVIVFQCRPIPFLWDNSLHGQCIDRSTFVILIFGNAAISLVTDAIFAIIPIVLIWNLQMSKKAKFSTGIVLSLGLSTSIVNIARFFFIGALKNTIDRPYKFYPIGLLSILEVGIGIIAASLATIRPLLERISRLFGDFANYAHSPQQITTRSDTETNTDTLSIKFGKSIIVPRGVREDSNDVDTHATIITGTKIEQSDIEAWAALCNATNIRAANETMALKNSFVRRSISKSNGDATEKIQP